MKKLLIGLLALGSLSAFAQTDCAKAIDDVSYASQRLERLDQHIEDLEFQVESALMGSTYQDDLENMRSLRANVAQRLEDAKVEAQVICSE